MLHPSILPIASLLLVAAVTTGVIVGYKSITSSAKKEQAAPVWKTRTILKGNQYVEERYRDATEKDVERQKRNINSAMTAAGRL